MEFVFPSTMRVKNTSSQFSFSQSESGAADRRAAVVPNMNEKHKLGRMLMNSKW